MSDTMIESTLRDTLTRTAGVVGVPDDPWPGFDHRAGRRRRSRQVRRAVGAGVLALLVGVQTNVVPLPGGTPGIAIAAPPSALADAPPRGALAGDRAWLDDLRARIGTDRELEKLDEPKGIWEIGDRRKIRLLYGSDLPRYRVALVVVPLRFGVLSTSALVWYVGPAGAAAGQMRYAGHAVGGDLPPVMTLMQAPKQGSGLAVVVGPVDSTVTISGEPVYTAAGRLEYRQLATRDSAGVGVAVLPPAPLGFQPVVRVSRGDEVIDETGLPGGPYAGPGPISDALLAAATRDTRGPALDRAVLADFVDAALLDSQLRATGTTVRVPWTGTVHGQPAALLTVQPARGGVIAYAMRGTERRGWTDLRLLMPAEGADRRPIAWRLRVEGAAARTDQVRVVAPAGAASATVTVAAGTPVPVDLDASGSGIATVPVDQPGTVTAYAADGAVLGSTPIPLGRESNFGQPPGDTPETRVVQ
ncbi:hypothetical protein [Plantactinospora sp. DSM 117369]